MLKVDEAWLNLTKEEPLEPELPICDAHHHLWGPPDTCDLTWKRPLERYAVSDFLRDNSAGHNIVSTVFVECGTSYRRNGPVEMRPVGETDFVISQIEHLEANETDVAAGIVGFADFALGGPVARVLEAHIEAGKGRFRGIRFACTWNSSPDIKSRASPTLLSEEKFRQGFACLERHGLSFEAWLYHPQLFDLVELARSFPGTVVILNHIGGLLGIGPYSGNRQEVFREWKRGIASLATCSNVYVKLGGLGMPISDFGWYKQGAPPHSTDLAEIMGPYFLWCIEKFGVDRCMFESNFPADKISCSYVILWNAFKRLSAGFSIGERAALFHDTAMKAYRLEPR